MASSHKYEPLPLPEGVSEEYVDCTSSCGLNFHVLQAGKPGDPLVLFCHGYPELAFSWRKLLPHVAATGYYCVAMDQRGYGRTTGWQDATYDAVDLSQYTMTNLVRDLVCLVYRLGYTRAACIVGHDFGAVASAMAALMRPDVFRATVQMSHPHHPPPTPPLGRGDASAAPAVDIHAALADLDPPRKHYKWYNSSPGAAHDWNNPPQGMEAYLRGYFHLKSADWPLNAPRPLPAWTAEALSVMPEYYIMRREDSFPTTVARGMDGQDATGTHHWLPPEDLHVYVDEWSRVGFQGALNWYRAQTASTPQTRREMLLFAGKRLEVPCVFVSGAQDWGNFQQPGALESYSDANAVAPGCFRGAHLIEHAGHWVQQEQPDECLRLLLAFFRSL